MKFTFVIVKIQLQMADNTTTPIVTTCTTQSVDNAIEEIKERWKGKMKNVCEECMSNAIRHHGRNYGRYCEREDDDDYHFERYDGNMYAYAGGDIGKLLEIIERLQNPPTTTSSTTSYTDNTKNSLITTNCILN